jgi:hypothetical protein
MLLELMVRPARAADVAGARQPALVKRHCVVQVALFRRTPAWREPAGSIARRDQFCNSGRRPVRQ